MMKAVLATVTAALLAAATACGANGGASCSDLRARLASLEAVPGSTEQNWNAVEEVADRSVERDSLREQLTQRGCP